MSDDKGREFFYWEIETQPGFRGFEWRVGPSPSNNGIIAPVQWTPWFGSFRFRNSAIRAARRYCRRMSLPGGGTWRDVEKVRTR